ncbi:hypothetical protein EVG20_g11271 [Dentipellis fragilis]|uniref:BTB domain-containing protein n=1 Tax=Dentipellis fragilis TaxID=205917 RepID=A0A4Y9XNU9_9AGAM|nr:hypothetical protein EVG20_g11271 [Dentipellis fragilis]
MSASSLSFTDSEDFDIMSETLNSSPRMPALVANSISSVEKATESPGTAPAPEHKHARFYFEDGNVTFLVQGVTYHVPRCFFCRHSSYFRTLFKNSPESEDPTKPIPLDNVACSEFDVLLSILYPTDFDKCELKTVESWTAVLRLSTEWSFPSIHRLAINRLQPIALAIDQVALGRTYGIEPWMGPGYATLCNREKPLTREEGLRLGFDDTMLIMTVRERMRVCRQDLSKCEVDGMVKAYLESSFDQAVVRLDDEITVGRRAYEEAIKRKQRIEEAAAKKAVEDAIAMKKANEEAAAKKAFKEAAAKKWAEEHSRKMEEVAAAKKRADEEAATRKEAEREAALKKWEDNYNRKEAEKAAAKERADDDAAGKRRAGGPAMMIGISSSQTPSQAQAAMPRPPSIMGNSVAHVSAPGQPALSNPHMVSIGFGCGHGQK